MADMTTVMRYDANKKSMVIAYLLWLFLGGLGGHRFYVGKTATALGMLGLTIVSLLTSFIFIGTILIIIPLVWALVDAFLIPGWIRRYNNHLITSLTATSLP